MSLARDTSMVADLVRSNDRDQLAVPISLNVMSPLVAMFDLTWIVLLGVAAELLYDAVALGGNGAAQNYLGSRDRCRLALFCVWPCGSALSCAEPPSAQMAGWTLRADLADGVCISPILAFLLKSGASFSRGGMLLLLISGIFVTVVMRLAVARVCTLVISSGALNPDRIVVVGLADQLAANGWPCRRC